jgi:ATP-dependent DNA helicase RecG
MPSTSSPSARGTSAGDGIASAKAAQKRLSMTKFGLVNESQWLLFSPSRFEDYRTFTEDFDHLALGNPVMLRGTLRSLKLYDARNNQTDDPRRGERLFAILANARGQTIAMSAFGRPGFVWMKHAVGDRLVVRGVPQRVPGKSGFALSNAQIVPSSKLGKIFPVYPALKQTKGERLAEEVARAWPMVDIAAKLIESDSGWLDPSSPFSIPEITGFKDARALLDGMHAPESVREGESARRAARIISALSLVRKTNLAAQNLRVDPACAIPIDARVVDELKARVPFPLTYDQKQAIDELCASLRSPVQTDGLLCGDVGSGKTLVFMVPAAAAFKAGRRVMVMTPNLLLINQFKDEMATFFPEVPVCTVTNKGVKGDPHGSIIVGSTALISALEKGKIGARPDFMIVDEQQKFSVEQRERLLAPHSNFLECTATPIPRTAALSIHGSKDLYCLHGIPVKKKIETEILTREQAKAGRDAVLSALERNEQAAVVYPLVAASDEESPEERRHSVIDSVDNWARFVPRDQIAVLHGKLSEDQKKSVIEEFRAGQKRLLIASTVVEVGVTLPELKTMLVVGAERFGVVTLHQLRGRLARRGGVGKFMLFSEEPDEDALARMSLLVDHEDGFTLAEKDAEARGYGDLLGLDGDVQSGATMTLFRGVNIGPAEISFASHFYDRGQPLGSTAQSSGDELADLVSQVSQVSQASQTDPARDSPSRRQADLFGGPR